MDNRINQNRIQKTDFQGIKPNKGEVKSMEELIRKIVKALLLREREIAEYGDFKLIEERFKNIDKELNINEFWLEIKPAPKGAENYQKMRSLKFVGSNPQGEEAEILIAAGTKEDIIAKLKDESLIERLKNNTEKLSYNLRGLQNH